MPKKVRKVHSKIVATFARRIKTLRSRLKMSQQALALKAETHLSFIGRCERAETNVTIETVERLAAALNVAPHELLLPDESFGHSLEPARQKLRSSVEATLKSGDKTSIEALTLIATALSRLQPRT